MLNALMRLTSLLRKHVTQMWEPKHISKRRFKKQTKRGSMETCFLVPQSGYGSFIWKGQEEREFWGSPFVILG
jgi:hypothetical protein